MVTVDLIAPHGHSQFFTWNTELFLHTGRSQLHTEPSCCGHCLCSQLLRRSERKPPTPMDHPPELSRLRQGGEWGAWDRHSSAATSLGPEQSLLGLVRRRGQSMTGRLPWSPLLGELGSQGSSRPHRPQKSPEQSPLDGGGFWSLRPHDGMSRSSLSSGPLRRGLVTGFGGQRQLQE